MEKARMFEICTFIVDHPTGRILFSYKIHMTSGKHIEFTEELTLPKPLDESLTNEPSVMKTLSALHMLLGTSYFKMYAPELITHPYTLSKIEADFWHSIYTKGMGEFYYVNNLDPWKLQPFEYNTLQSPPLLLEHKTRPNLQLKALVLHGGGKDSLTSVEIVRDSGVNFDLFSLNISPIQELAAQAVSQDVRVVKRVVDQHMVEMTQSGQAYTGHVPISVIYAFVALLYALIHGYDSIIASNEAGADYGNVNYHGMQVNHQWAKSLEAERLTQQYISNVITENVSYFSLLRPFHEIKIVEMFSRFEKYFTSFSSSNHHFTIQDGKSLRWDLSYSKGKVEFVFALFAAFLPKEKVMTIFEEDLFARSDVLPRYQELLGRKGVKPLDCVGTSEETAVAMYVAHQGGEYKGEPVMSYFEKEILPSVSGNIKKMQDQVLSYGNDSGIPGIFKDALLRAYSGQKAYSSS